MNSFNHYAYGAVGDWMVRCMAGLDLDPEEPGYRHIRFRPRPGGTITWAEAKLKTVLGNAAIRWNLDASTGDLHLDLTVPKGSQATLDAPASYVGSEKEFAPGNHRVVLSKKIALRDQALKISIDGRNDRPVARSEATPKPQETCWK